MFKSKTIRNTGLYDVLSAVNGYIRQKLSVASETHLLDSVGDYHGTQHEKYVYESDGIGTKITSSHITNQTVVSKKGTASLTIVTGEIQISAGWVTEIELSDGTLYRCEEQQGTTAFDSSGNGNHGELINNITHTTKKDITLINYTNEYGYTNNSGIIIPRIINSDLDTLGNTCEFIGKVSADMKLINSNCISSNGISVIGTFNFSCAGLSITSKEGTATVTFDTTANTITIGAGTLYNIVLSNGYHFPIAEGLGTKSYRVLDYEKYITWTNITWTTQNEYHYNINNGFTDDGAKLPFKGLVKVKDEPWTWITQGHYDIWKNNCFLPSDNGTLLKGDAIDYAAVTEIDLSNQSLTTDFTNDFFKFNNLQSINIENNNVSVFNYPLVVSLKDFYLSNNQITSFDENQYLRRLEIENNKLTSINIASRGNVTYIDLRNNTLLTSVTVNFNSKLNTLLLDGCLNATYINIRSNNLTSLDYNFLNVSFLNVRDNKLTSLDLENSNVSTLLFQNNNINSINITGCANIVTLEGTGNNLTSITLNTTALNRCLLNNNNFDATANDYVLQYLDTQGNNNGFVQLSGSLTAAGLTAKANLQAKGWNVLI